jgi:hypothetical protein
MADVWVNGLMLVMKSKWTPEFKQKIGESVLNALFQQYMENQQLPEVDFNTMESEEWLKYMAKDNSRHNTTIAVNSN